MRYLLMICAGPDFIGPDGKPVMDGCNGWTEEMMARGVLHGGAGLQPPDDATTVRVRGAETLLTDGPFAETKEQIGGFVIIEAADLDEAIAITAKHPMARLGAIEIRPLAPPPAA